MERDLAQFLRAHHPFAVERVHWGADIELEQSCYLGTDMPPDDYITSVRVVLLKGDEVLVLRDKTDAYHLLPGGRRDAGETILQTLEREVREETRWTFVAPQLIGFMHFLHQTPKPPAYAYPYPSFLQLVYAAEAGGKLGDTQIEDEWVEEAFFVDSDALGPYSIDCAQFNYLRAARSVQGGRAGL